jgi:hypothetical protein
MAIGIGAAVGGALLGGLLVYQSTGSPRGTPARLAETTGAAAPAAPVAKTEQPAVQEATKESAADCEQQTWPHLSHECAEQKRRSVRVITTDKLPGPTVNAIETSPPSSATVPPMNPGLAAKPAPAQAAPSAPAPATTSAPAIASTPAPAIASTPAPPVSSTPAPPVSSTPPQVASRPAPTVTATKPAPTVAATASAQPASAAPPPPSPLAPAAQVANVEPNASPPSPSTAVTAKHPKDVGKKSQRKKAKSRDRSIDDDDTRSGERREGRIVERWIERDYDVSSDDRSGRRKRVTVIERGNGRSERTSERSERAIERPERREDSFFGLFRF